LITERASSLEKATQERDGADDHAKLAKFRVKMRVEEMTDP
jgi:hypothetical protein